MGSSMWMRKRRVGLSIVCAFWAYLGLRIVDPSAGAFSLQSSSSPISFNALADNSLASRRVKALTQTLQEFRERCRGDGVLVCEGFDSADAVHPAVYPGSGLYPAADGAFRGTIDSTVTASGRGALRFEVPPHSPANSSGYWYQSFGRSFGESTAFYVQFRQRFSREMLKNDFGDTTWKQVIFHNDHQTCTELGITTVQYYHDGFPMMYTACGARMVATNEGVPPYQLEQGDYKCWYGQYNSKSCFMYPQDEWVTFYYEIRVGHWNKPDSTINAWVALDGQQYKQWIQMPRFTLQNENPGKDFDSLTLLTYMTNKSALKNHPTAYTWYDELIVSSKPIPPPVHSGGSSGTK